MAESRTNGTGAGKTEWYAGASRFELELEFVQSLSNPYYLHHLCVQKFFEDDSFVEWCKYLKYFAEPKYLPFLSYPGPTLKALDLVQQEQFRKDILRPDVVERLTNDWMTAFTEKKE
ncbi:hypothetical protein WHR41_00415 [Cladosporium halotolerans]|uniref:Mediator of RNA polymerase II transcription subunit 31 n=1 Tax=Cladosporium halotolerans TaxID=1052096 RepID=A0AB34L630_9PEZI